MIIVTLSYLYAILCTLYWTFHDWSTLGLDEIDLELRKEKPTPTYITTTGPFQGKRYHLVIMEGKRYRVYEDGTEILVGDPTSIEQKWITSNANAITSVMRVINGK